MLWLALAAGVLLALGGMLGLIGRRDSSVGDRVLAACQLCGGLLLAAVGAMVLASGKEFDWLLPGGGVGLRLDALAGAFLLPIGLIPAAASVYATEYWRAGEHPATARRTRACFGILTAAMAGVVVAGDARILLYAWEIMAVAAFFLIVSDEDDEEVRRAGWIYLVATHLGTLALLAMFALLREQTGSFALAELPGGVLTPGAVAALLPLALVGFGVKAGVFPLHLWLPGAHANAPSHVSAVLSGVMLKVGVYGVMRVLWLTPDPPRWWGFVLLAVGAASALYGAAQAAAQADYKRLLAYSSVENVGVIFLALGLLALGLTDRQPALAVCGLTAAVLHLWNHSLFKSLMFLVAGSVLHATGTRAMNRLGGVARCMPRVTVIAALGCLAACALPPLNGFIGEWLLYSGLLRSGAAGSTASALGSAAAVAALALVGAITLVAFVRLFGVVFLGVPRSPDSARAHDPGPAMLAPLLVLATACVAIGVLPAPAVAAAGRVAVAWPELVEATAAVPGRVWTTIGGLVGGTAIVALGVIGWLRLRAQRGSFRAVGTWDCGFSAPTSRMQYRSAGLSQGVVRLFAWLLVPRRTGGALIERFPDAGRSGFEISDPILDRGVLPASRRAVRWALRLRLLQRGRIQTYVLYILLFTILLLFLL